MTDARGKLAPVAPPPAPPQDRGGFYQNDFSGLAPMRGAEDMPSADWVDTLAASFRSTRRDISGYSIDEATHEYKGLVDVVTAATGKPWTVYVNPQTGQTDREGVWRDLLAYRSAHPKAFPGVPGTREEFDRQAAEQSAAGHAADTGTMARGPLTARLLGGFGAGLTDPFTLGTIFVGGAGKTVAQRIVTEGLANAGIEALEQPLIAIERAKRGERLGLDEAALNVGSAGLLGAGTQGLVAEPLGALFKRVLGPRATEAELGAADALDRANEIEATSPYGPGTGTEAHVARLEAETNAILLGRPSPAQPSARARLNSGTSLDRPVAIVPRETLRGTSDGVGPRERVKAMIGHAENATGDPNARNPKSSATGVYQFTEDTWKRYYVRRFGRGGLSDAEIAAKRSDPALQDRLMDDLLADNAAALARIGARETPGNLYLMHFLGQGGAEKVLRAAPETPIERLIGEDAIAANPFLRGKSAGDVIGWANGRMGDPGSGAPVLRRDLYGSDEEWRAAQAESDAAEAELAAVRRRADGADPSEDRFDSAGDVPRETSVGRFTPAGEAPSGTDWEPALAATAAPNYGEQLKADIAATEAGQLPQWAAVVLARVEKGNPHEAANVARQFREQAVAALPEARARAAALDLLPADVAGRMEAANVIFKDDGTLRGFVIRDVKGNILRWDPASGAAEYRRADLRRETEGRQSQMDAASFSAKARTMLTQGEDIGALASDYWSSQRAAGERLTPLSFVRAISGPSAGRIIGVGREGRAAAEAFAKERGLDVSIEHVDPPIEPADTAAAKAFDDPEGEGVTRQAESLDHDARLAAEADPKATFRIGEEGAPMLLADLLAEHDAELAAIEAARRCL